MAPMTPDQLTLAYTELRQLVASYYTGTLTTLGQQNLAVMADINSLQLTLGVAQDSANNIVPTGLQLLVQQCLDSILNLQTRVTMLETQMDQLNAAPAVPAAP